jgi:hypothetical protein
VAPAPGVCSAQTWHLYVIKKCLPGGRPDKTDPRKACTRAPRIGKTLVSRFSELLIQTAWGPSSLNSNSA